VDDQVPVDQVHEEEQTTKTSTSKSVRRGKLPGSHHPDAAGPRPLRREASSFSHTRENVWRTIHVPSERHQSTDRTPPHTNSGTPPLRCGASQARSLDDLSTRIPAVTRILGSTGHYAIPSVCLQHAEG
jgi:hypothetical protein